MFDGWKQVITPFNPRQDEESNEHVDIAKLPLISTMNSIDAKEGEIRVFNNEGTAEAYVFKDRKWDKIGEVLGTKESKNNYPGDRFFPAGPYDYVFDVELEGTTSKLPFNKGDNALVAAEKFVTRENLHKLYVDDVTKFLRQNTQPNTSFKSVERKPANPKSTTNNSGVKFPLVKFI